jgi:hypothetical protein
MRHAFEIAIAGQSAKVTWRELTAAGTRMEEEAV